MSEIALVSAKKIRLEHMAHLGDKGAKAALALGAEPTRLLSTGQTGITLITLGMGAFGESAFTQRLEIWSASGHGRPNTASKPPLSW